MTGEIQQLESMTRSRNAWRSAAIERQKGLTKESGPRWSDLDCETPCFNRCAAQDENLEIKLDLIQARERPDRLEGQLNAANHLISLMRQESRGHAMEARSANHTIAECYQAVTDNTGEPGNWNGAEPVRKFVADSVLRYDRVKAERDEWKKRAEDAERGRD